MQEEVKRAIQANLFDPTNPASFTGKLSLIRKQAQELTEKKVTLDDVKTFRSENSRIQLSRRRIRRFGERLSTLRNTATPSFLPRFNDGRRGQRTLTCIIDCFCRFISDSLCVFLPHAAAVFLQRDMLS